MTVADLPAVNATLNATSTVLLCAGYVCILQKKIAWHKVCMLAAFTVSTIFLICYLTYHYYHGATTFPKQYLWPRRIYLTILISHTILAVTIVPMILITLRRAWREQFDRHKIIARWTLPLWLYVSVTGVIVYWMLYQSYPVPVQ